MSNITQTFTATSSPGRVCRSTASISSSARHCQASVAGVLVNCSGWARLPYDESASMRNALRPSSSTTENVVYEMMAEELGHYAIRVMWDARDGGAA